MPVSFWASMIVSPNCALWQISSWSESTYRSTTQDNTGTEKVDTQLSFLSPFGMVTAGFNMLTITKPSCEGLKSEKQWPSVRIEEPYTLA
jgi:hypothetical protein